MKWVSGAVCAALVGDGLVGIAADAGSAGAATPYDDCTKSAITSTTERVTCSYSKQGVTSTLFVPRIATAVRVVGVGGRGSSGPFSGDPLVSQASIDAPLDGVVGRTISLLVGGDAQGSTGGFNGGGAGGAGYGGGGGSASQITLGDGMVVFVAPGGGGSGGAGVDEGTDPLDGGVGGTLTRTAGTGEFATAAFGISGGGGGFIGSPDFGGSGGLGGGFGDENGNQVRNSNSGDGADHPSGGGGGTGGAGPLPGHETPCSPTYGQGGGGGGGYTGGGGGGAGGTNGAGGDTNCAGGGGGGSGTNHNWMNVNGATTYLASTSSAPILSVSWTQALAFTSGDAPNGAAGQPYSFRFTSDVANSTFRVVSGSTPPGLTLSPSGVLDGTPTTKASYGFTVEATDPDHAAQRQTVQSVTIAAAPAAPVTFTNGTPPTATKGKAYSFQFTASNCPGCTFSRVTTAGGTPPGLKIAGNGCPGRLRHPARSSSPSAPLTRPTGRRTTRCR